MKKYNFCSIITKNGKRYQKKGYSKTIPKNFLPKKIIDKIKKIVSPIGKRYKNSIILKNGIVLKNSIILKKGIVLKNSNILKTGTNCDL